MWRSLFFSLRDISRKERGCGSGLEWDNKGGRQSCVCVDFWVKWLSFLSWMELLRSSGETLATAHKVLYKYQTQATKQVVWNPTVGVHAIYGAHSSRCLCMIRTHDWCECENIIFWVASLLFSDYLSILSGKDVYMNRNHIPKYKGYTVSPLSCFILNTLFPLRKASSGFSQIHTTWSRPSGRASEEESQDKWRVSLALSSSRVQTLTFLLPG